MNEKEEPNEGRPAREMTKPEERKIVVSEGGDPVAMLKKRIALIHTVQRDIMIKDSDYGVIPGCGDKPALLKPGAEKIIATFRLAPELHVEKEYIELDGVRHLTVGVHCRMLGPNGEFLGEGVGSCSTMETKYRWRKGTRKCPACSAEAIIKGKEEYGGGWICWKKKDGCGAKFADGDQSVESQSTERVPNIDVADQYNTVLKMAKKRALVDATLTVSGVSDLFTQDIEEQGRKSKHDEPDNIPQDPEQDPELMPDPKLVPSINALSKLFKKIYADCSEDERQSLWLELVGPARNLTEKRIKELGQEFTAELKNMKEGKK